MSGVLGTTAPSKFFDLPEPLFPSLSQGGIGCLLSRVSALPFTFLKTKANTFKCVVQHFLPERDCGTVEDIRVLEAEENVRSVWGCWYKGKKEKQNMERRLVPPSNSSLQASFVSASSCFQTEQCGLGQSSVRAGSRTYGLPWARVVTSEKPLYHFGPQFLHRGLLWWVRW